MRSSLSLISRCEELDPSVRVDLQPVDGEEVQDGAEVYQEGAVRDDGAQDDGGQRGEVEEGEPPRCVPCLGNLTSTERMTYEITHWP